jgi:(Z)-2-((N-methylformamido)methylene)-5-hydroxybutyrolactone dehydrogenase
LKVYQLYVDGKSVPGSGDPFLSTNPYDEQPWAQIARATPADVDLAVSAAHNAYETTWRKTSGLFRAGLMLKLAAALDDKAEYLAKIETTDNGKVVRESKSQVHFAARNYRFFAGCADKITGETKPLDSYSVLDYTVREPLGAVALITAWNSPLSLLANKLAPALAAGNTVVIKPSEYTSASTLEFAKLTEEAGFPPGVINVVTGWADTGQALVDHRHVTKVSFTGSVATGIKIAQAAASRVIPVTLELGGKSANIIFADANLDRAIPGAVSGIFAAAGQTCVAGSRLLVHRSVYRDVVEAVVQRARVVHLGDPLDPVTEMGPVAHQKQLDGILADISDARSQGAHLLTGGSRHGDRGLFVEPTVFGEVENAMHIAQKEVFGPVLGVIPFSTDEEAVEIANDTQFGLAAGIWTEKLARAHSVAKELRCGTVWVNTFRRTAAQAPSGGWKGSGYGRERGVEALLEYTQIRNVMIDLSDTISDPFMIKT